MAPTPVTSKCITVVKYYLIPNMRACATPPAPTTSPHHTLRVKFWEKMLKVNAVVPALWIPAFYDPNQFMNALK